MIFRRLKPGQPVSRIRDCRGRSRIYLGLPEDRPARLWQYRDPLCPRQFCLELKSLKEYLQAFRNLGIFQENVVNQVLEDVVRWAKPVWAEVKVSSVRAVEFRRSLSRSGRGQRPDHKVEPVLDYSAACGGTILLEATVSSTDQNIFAEEMGIGAHAPPWLIAGARSLIHPASNSQTLVPGARVIARRGSGQFSC